MRAEDRMSNGSYSDDLEKGGHVAKDEGGERSPLFPPLVSTN